MADKMGTQRAGKVFMGTCGTISGWSDQTLLRCGKFYPASVRSAEERLQHYSSHFPCVEVDTSTYAIPSKSSIKRWLQSVPQGFLFHFKAFGLFCSKSCPMGALPASARTALSSMKVEHVQLDSIPTPLQDEIWQIFNNSLEPVHESGHLGLVVFQFHLSFKPSEENKRHVLWCRHRLDSQYPMAAEFRCREWFTGYQKSDTMEWLKTLGIVLIAADELEHETYQKDRHQTGLPEGKIRAVLPIAWTITQPEFVYIRVHRREGNHRILFDTEILEWEARIRSALDSFTGEIYFMWGTDWEDQPLINAKNLSSKLEGIVFDWKSAQKMTQKGSLYSLFRTKAKSLESSISHESLQAHDFGKDGAVPLDISKTLRLPTFVDIAPEVVVRQLNKSPLSSYENAEDLQNYGLGLKVPACKAVVHGSAACKRAVGQLYNLTTKEPQPSDVKEGIEVSGFSVLQSSPRKKLRSINEKPEVLSNPLLLSSGTLLSFFKRVS